MSKSENPDDAKYARLASPLLGVVLGLFLFEVLSGAVVTFWPGLRPWLQWNALLHALAGLALVVPLAAYSWTHWKRAKGSERRSMVWIGSAAFAAAAVSGATGFWAAGAAAFGERVPPLARASHLWSSYAAAGLVGFHLFVSLRRLRALAPAASAWRSSSGKLGSWSAGVCGALAVATVVLAFAGGTRALKDGVPAGYSLPYGPNPFAPSNAMTASGSALDHRRLSGSKECGVCHAEIYKEWKSSAHRWSSTDPFFRAVAGMMVKENSREATRYCAACHDPVALLTAAVDPHAKPDSPGSDEGSSCLLCHSIKALNGTTQGNGNYLLQPAREYLFAGDERLLEKGANYFLTRALPKAHREDLAADFQATPELCSTCHKQFIDKEINHVGWVQLQNQYDDWRKGHYHVEGHPEKTLACLDCHMRRVASTDPARGADGKHHSHRFIAANQTIPWLDKDDEQVRLSEDWLKGLTDLPEIRSRWAEGPAVPIRIDAPSQAFPGRKYKWQVVVTNNKVGHGFPTGPLDIIETWLDVAVVDAAGKTVYRSGFLDDKNYVDKNAFFFRSRGVSKEGKLIDRHNLWDMVGQKTKRSIFVGYSDAAEYETVIPRGARGPLTIAATLRYRKFNQFIVDLVMGKGKRLPITDMSSDKVAILLPTPAREARKGR